MPSAELVGLEEVRTGLFYRRLVAEALGTAMLVIFGCGAVIKANPDLTHSVISVAFAFGLTIATIIWSVGNVSGAQLNPSVTLTMFVTRKISLTRCVGYIIVQCVGAIVGAAILWYITPEHRRGSLGATLVRDEITLWQGFIVEVLATFMLVLTVFASCDRMRADHSGSVALSIGLVVTMDIPWAIQYTGASMNPARSFGPSVVTGLWQHHWLYWVAPIVGALVAGLMYEGVFAQRHQEPGRADEMDKRMSRNFELDIQDAESSSDPSGSKEKIAYKIQM